MCDHLVLVKQEKSRAGYSEYNGSVTSVTHYVASFVSNVVDSAIDDVKAFPVESPSRMLQIRKYKRPR